MEIRTDRKIAVVGAGTMGIGIAQVASSAGHMVVVVDQDEAALGRGKAALQASLDQLAKRGRIATHEAAIVAARVHWSSDLRDAAGSALAVEAIVERLDAKRALFAKLEVVLETDAILASNTSSLSISDMAEQLEHPSRFLGLHFFNPVPAMKLVEIVSAPASAADVADTAAALMKQWGKHPVSVRDVPGFIVNRIARPYYAEAFIAWDEGLAPELIDVALTGSGGFKMGPLTLADLIGHDINYAAASSVYDGMQPATRFRPQLSQARLVEEGKLGRKTGLGVYDYGAKQVGLPAPADVTHLPIQIAKQLVGLTALKPALASATVNTRLWPDTLVIGDSRVALGDGRTLQQRKDVDILIDYALDFASSTILVVTVRDERARRAAESLAAMLSKALVVTPDRPGQIVLRTFAQIANGAIDALHDHVADAAAIDDAMHFGANYPIGPIAWLHKAGFSWVRQVLANIAAETGDCLYTPASPWELT